MLHVRILRVLLAILTAVVAAGVYLVSIATPPGPRALRDFEPDRTAAFELDKWQANYSHENTRLFRDLVTMLHDENHYTWAKAAEAGFHLARAASTFATATSDFVRVVPDLTSAYTTERNWAGARFDPAAVARAELAWWVARRVKGQDSPERVGGLIADENALIYDVPRERVLDASILRARAGKLRDDGGDHADWDAISKLLNQSYRALYEAVQ